MTGYGYNYKIDGVYDYSKAVDGLGEDTAFVVLFTVLIRKNGYYEGIRRWSKNNGMDPDEVAYKIAKLYDRDSRCEYLSPYKFLDGIEEFMKTLDSGKEYENIEDIVDAVDFELV